MIPARRWRSMWRSTSSTPTGALPAFAPSPVSEQPTNLVDMVLTPGPIRDAVENWDDVAGYLMHRMRERTRSFGPSDRLQVGDVAGDATARCA